MVAKHLAIVASERVWDVWTDFNQILAQFQFIWDLWFPEGENICVSGNDLVVVLEGDFSNISNITTFKV